MIILGKVLSADDHNNFLKVLSADDHNDFLAKCCQRTTIMILSKVLSADDHNDFEYSVVSGRP